MDGSPTDWLDNFIWGIADDVLRSLKEIREDTLALEQETEGLLSGIIGEGARA